MILPSKKVLSLLILTTAVVGSIIIVFGREKTSSAINFASNLTAGEKLKIPENPNWQNELGQLDFSNTTTEESTETPVGQSTTDTISTTIASNYLALKQSGTLDQESAQKLIDQTIEFVSQSDTNTIKLSQLNIIPDNGIQTITQYGENLGLILKNNKPKEIKNEFAILKEALDSGNPKKLDDLQQIINVYQKIYNELIKIPVPQSFAKAHLDMINGANGLVTGLKTIQTVFADPLQGLRGVQVYQNSGDLFVTALGASSEFIKQNNITYKQGSGGYYLLYGI